MSVVTTCSNRQVKLYFKSATIIFHQETYTLSKYFLEVNIVSSWFKKKLLTSLLDKRRDWSKLKKTNKQKLIKTYF